MSIHHFTNPAAVLAEVRRVLKPGGRLVVADIVSADDADDVALHNAIEVLRDPSHVRMLPAGELVALVADAGLDIVARSSGEQPRTFEEWAKIVDDPARVAPLRTVVAALARAGATAGIGLALDGEDIRFIHRWLLVARTGRSMKWPRLLYFAYGSNMLVERLRVADRCPSATRIGRATAAEHTVVFHKLSNRDGSGKATLHPEPGATVPRRPLRDRRTGTGRARPGGGRRQRLRTQDDFEVVVEGITRVATTYIATDSHRDAGLVPFDWYHALVVAGARQHGLPADYVARLEAVATAPDPDPHRPEKRNALRLLHEAGHADLVARIATLVTPANAGAIASAHDRDAVMDPAYAGMTERVAARGAPGRRLRCSSGRRSRRCSWSA